MTNRSRKWHKQLRESVLNDPEGRAEYEAFGAQLELAEKMRELRSRAALIHASALGYRLDIRFKQAT